MFLTSALDGGDQSDSHPGRLTPTPTQVRVSSTHWISTVTFKKIITFDTFIVRFL